MALGLNFGGSGAGDGESLFSAFTSINNMFTTTTKLSNGDLSIGRDDGITVGKGGISGGSYGATALGKDALLNTTSGLDNTAVGYSVLKINTIGNYNTAVGSNSMTNASGSNVSNNVAIGVNSLNKANGDSNIGIGVNSLFNTTSNYNIGIGTNAAQGNITGIDNISIGLNTNYSNTNLNNTIAIGNNANCSVTNQITLGNTSISSLRCNVQSISSLSDERDKTDIIEIAEGLEFVNKLNPVTFTWNQRDGNRVGIKASGFIAQDLLELQSESSIGENLDLVTDIDPLKLEARYNNLLPVLVKAIQELTARINVLEGN